MVIRTHLHIFKWSKHAFGPLLRWKIFWEKKFWPIVRLKDTKLILDLQKIGMKFQDSHIIVSKNRWLLLINFRMLINCKSFSGISVTKVNGLWNVSSDIYAKSFTSRLFGLHTRTYSYMNYQSIFFQKIFLVVRFRIFVDRWNMWIHLC